MKDKNAIPTALCTLTKKYGNEHWFAGVAAYGDNCVILYYRDTKNVPIGNEKFRHFAGVSVKWQKIS